MLACRLSLLQIAVEPIEDGLEPHHAVRGTSRPGELVALGREPHHLHVLLEQAERDEEMFALFDRSTQVILRVEDQQRGGEVRGVAGWGHRDLAGEVFPY